MKERPILFSGEMVRAILDGRKMQTRRVIKPQPVETGNGWFEWGHKYGAQKSTSPKSAFWHGTTWHENTGSAPIENYCPYGAPGDLLWVKETWAINKAYNRLPGSKIPKSEHGSVWYAAEGSKTESVGRTRSARFMPRWASRITLEIISVRVERVQDIGEDDVLAEGVDLAYWGNNYDWPKTAGFAELWDSINDARGFGWDANPWVWVIEFSADNAEGDK